MRDVSLPKTVRRSEFRGEVYTVKGTMTLISNTYSSDNLPDWARRTILRSSDIATTASSYVETSDVESSEALDKLAGLMG